MVRSLAAAALLAGSGLAVVADQAAAQSPEEITALKQQIDLLKAQLDQLQQQMEAQGAAVAKAAEEDARRDDTLKKLASSAPTSGNDKVRLEISGQVNRGLLVIDDGEETDAFHVDNDNSSTRLRLVGEADVSDEFTVGTNIEVQFESNSTAAVSQDNERDVGPNNFTERKLELYFEHDSFGKLSLGQGDTASNSTSEVDFSGTSVVGYSGVADLAGGIQFRDGDGNLSGTDIGDTFSNLDGLSRDDRIRYDTPKFGGFQLSTSAAADSRYDAAARFGGDFGSFKVGAAVAYATVDGEWDQVNGSASVLFNKSISLTAAAGTRDFDDGGRDDAMFYYVKAGYEMNPFTFGSTALAIDYYAGEDFGTEGDDATAIGAFAVQKIDAAATELYIGGRVYDLDRNNEDFDEIYALLTGARVKF